MRRSIESLVTRLTTQWTHSQPSHLRHLAIVRDTAMSGTVAHYVHYSYPTFQDLVENGKAFWEAVTGTEEASEKKGKRAGERVHEILDIGVERDEFGFAIDPLPAFQYRDGQGTIAEALRAVKPEAYESSRWDPVLVEAEPGKYSVRFGLPHRRGNKAGSTQPSRTSTPASSRPAIPTRTPKTQQTGSRAKPLGRPRKYLPGTERFWQSQFFKANCQAQPRRKSMGMAGVTTDPAGQALFTSRPRAFDETLVRALNAGLPVPEEPQYISQDWVDKICRVLDRSVTGIYMSPRGEHPNGWNKKGRVMGQTMIIKSSRLGEVDFLSTRKAPKIRFLTSSAAHSFTHLRPYPICSHVQDSVQTTAPPSRPKDSHLTRKDRMHAAPEMRLRPPTVRVGTTLPPCGSAETSKLAKTTPAKRGRPRKNALQGQFADTPRLPTSGEHPLLAESTIIPSPSELQVGSSSITSPGQVQSRTLHRLSPTLSPYGVAPLLTRRSTRRQGQSDSATSNSAVGSPDGRLAQLDTQSSHTITQGNAMTPTTTLISNQLGEPLPESLGETWTAPNASPLTALLPQENVLVNDVDLNITDKIKPNEAVTGHALRDTIEPRMAGTDQQSVSTSYPQTAPAYMEPFIDIVGASEQVSISGSGTNGTCHKVSSHPETPIPIIRLPALNTEYFDEQSSEAYQLIQELEAEIARDSFPATQVTGTDVINPASARYNSKNYPTTIENGRQPDVAQAEEDTSPEPRESDLEPEYEAPQRRMKHGTIGGSIGVLRRKIVLDIVETCNGAVPFYSNILWNAFVSAWQKAGQSGKPDNRTVTTAVKSLCDNGKLKQMTFSFKDKCGVMTKRAIIARPELGLRHLTIQELQRKVIEAHPTPYYPPQMTVNNELKKYPPKLAQALPPQSKAEIVDTIVSTTHMPSASALARVMPRSGPRKRSRPESSTEKNGADGPRKVVRLNRIGRIPTDRNDGGRPYQRPKLAKLFKYPRERLAPDLRTSLPSDTPVDRTFFRSQFGQAPLVFEANVTGGDGTAIQAPISGLSHKEGSEGSHRNKFWHDIRSIRPTSQGGSVATLMPSPSIAAVSQPGMVIWKKVADQTLPTSLDDIMADDKRRKKRDHSKALDPEYSKFEWEIDGVAMWEQRSFNLFQKKAPGFQFINHTIGKAFEAYPLPNVPTIFAKLTWFDDSGHEMQGTWLAPPDVSAASTPVLLPSGHQALFPPVQPRDPNAPRPLPEGFNPGVKSQGSRRRRGGARARHSKRTRIHHPTPSYIIDANGNQIDVTSYIDSPFKKSRGVQHLRNMPEAVVYKITVTVVVVRTLVGGLEKYIDWNLVMRVFPDEDVQFIRDRWKTLQNKYRRDISMLTESLQERFLHAYAKGKVPELDFDDLESCDWNGIVEWAVESLDKPAPTGIEELPGRRSEFDEAMRLSFDDFRGYGDVLVYNNSSTVPQKEAAQASVVFARPLRQETTDPTYGPWCPLPASEDALLSVAKSWALATTSTPDHLFDAHTCHDKLSRLATTPKASEALLDQALKALTQEKAVSRKKDKSTGIIGRSYDLSARFQESLFHRRMVQAAMLKQAAFYKREVLDVSFAKGERVVFHPAIVEDGDMVAILNLVARGRVRLVIGDDVPRNRYGIPGETAYQTRLLEKEKLYFTVLIEAVSERYVLGDPSEDGRKLLPVPGKPSKEPNNKDRIPIWFDIHGHFLREQWQLLMAGVLGLISTRPGIDVGELCRNLAPCLSVWEAEIVVDWCHRCGLVSRIGAANGRWETTEWWWMACGSSLSDDLSR